jgi:hypothetical protein
MSKEFEEFLKRNPQPDAELKRLADGGLMDLLPLCKCPFGVCHGKEDTNRCKRDEIMKTDPKLIKGYEECFGPMKRSKP